MSLLKRMAFFMFLSVWLMPQCLFGGNWGSGGGTLLRDQNNPWFISNTKTVKYCIVLDPSVVSASEDDIAKQIRRALDYWREQFQYAYYGSNAEILRTAQQTFIRDTCPSNLDDAAKTIDVVFQFGVLTAKQHAYLKDPRDYIAITTRTDYDPRNLRGKGFIYFSPDSGPNRYSGARLMERAWSAGHGGPLYHVIAHELGHVFGLPHFGTQFDLMGEGYPGFVLTTLGDKPISPDLMFNIFKPQEQFESGLPASQIFCAPPKYEDFLKPLLRFFFINDDKPCVRFRLTEHGAELHYKDTPDSQPVLAGNIEFDKNVKHTDDSYQMVGSIEITKAQTVIPNISPLVYQVGVVPGPEIVTSYRTGLYRDSHTGKQRQVILRISPREIHIGGLVDNAVVFDIFRYYYATE